MTNLQKQKQKNKIIGSLWFFIAFSFLFSFLNVVVVGHTKYSFSKGDYLDVKISTMIGDEVNIREKNSGVKVASNKIQIREFIVIPNTEVSSVAVTSNLNREGTR